MDDAQRTRLQTLADSLCERVLDDANPANWSGGGKLPRDMTKEERGDDLWCRKQAAAALVLFAGINRLLESDELPPPLDGETEEELIARAEKEATAALERMKRTDISRGHTSPRS